MCTCVFFCLSVCFCVCLFMTKLNFKGGRGHSLGQCAAFKKNNFVYSVETFGFSRFAFVLRSRRVERLKSREKVQVIKNWSNTKKWSRRQNTFLWLSQVENGNKFWRLFKALRSNKDVHSLNCSLRVLPYVPKILAHINAAHVLARALTYLRTL